MNIVWEYLVDYSDTEITTVLEMVLSYIDKESHL